MLKFAIIGMGGLGKVHYQNAQELAETEMDIKLVALCDAAISAFHTQTATDLGECNTEMEFSSYHLYDNVESLLENEKLDFVIIALPTFIHEKIAVMAMNQGIHVFCEKPMALTSEQGEHMLRAAHENNVKLMIGHCLRYSEPYIMLKDIIDGGKYGKVISADFFRISPIPNWTGWMLDETKSGGAALDLHIHEADLINWMFGRPSAVTSFATNFKAKHESISTVYHYEDKLVTAKADWGMPGCFKFQSGFTVRFENAVIVKNAEGMYLYPESGEPVKLEPSKGKEYREEIVDFISCVRQDKESEVNPATDSYIALKIALAEKVSADACKAVKL